MNLDAQLGWKEHIKKITKHQVQKDVYWLMGKKSALSVSNKIIFYKQVSKPVNFGVV